MASNQFAVNPEGVKALKDLSSSINEGKDTIKQETEHMSQVADQYAGTLGPHRSELSSALDGIKGAFWGCVEPVNEISEKLNRLAERYQGIIDKNPFGSMGN